MERVRPVIARFARILGPDQAAVGQTLVALALSIVATLLAGLTLASAEERLSELPGLLLLVPAAIAQRGNVFGAMGSRLGTAIHTGTFRISTRPDTLFGQNVLAAIGLSWVAATWLAIMAKLLAVSFGVSDSMSVLDFLAVSVVGGMLASLVVLASTVALAAGSTRYGWDLDNVTAPLVTAVGDLVTLPALMVGSLIVTENWASEILGAVALSVAIALLAAWFRLAQLKLVLLRRIIAESLPVLAIASTVSLFAGATIENRLGSFLEQPALLVLVPTYFGMAGALGGILSSRLSTKLHLGLIPPAALPSRSAWGDIRSVAVLSVPIFIAVGIGANLGAALLGIAGPGLAAMVGVAVLAGVGAISVVVLVAYYGTLGAVRFGLDPDTAGIPLTNSVLDLVGAFTLVAAIVVLGVA